MSGIRRAAMVLGALAAAAAAGLPARAEAPRAGAPAGAPAPGTARERPAAEVVKEADAAFAREDFKTARTLYRQAVGLQPENVHALQRLALLESWDNDLEASAADYRRALALAPDDFDIRLGLARVLSWSHDYDESIDLFRTLRGGHPDDARVLLGLGNVLSWAGRYSEAESVFKDMEDRRIEPLQAHAGRARLRGWQGNLDEAERFWRDVLRADPGNLDARIGMAYVHHWQGLDRTALEQAENIVVDHPESKDAKELQETMRLSQRPHGDADTFRYSDTDSNRVDGATASCTFMAEPQTSIRLAYSTYEASFRCEDPQFCDEPGLAVGDEVDTRAQALVGTLTSRVLRPLVFNARLGALREETFGGGARVVGTLGGYLRWQVGPRFAVGTSGGRDGFLDTAPLIDRGIRTTDANARVEYRFRPAWLLSGSAGAAAFSDGNARRTAGATLEWRLPARHPFVSGNLDVRYRAFNADKDNGYFDPLRYDSELLTVAVWDDYGDGRFYWRLEGTYGRQAFTLGAVKRDDSVSGGTGLAGINFAHGKAALEASYARSDYALNVAQGFTYSRTGFLFRFRF
jgi:tetratricopeptide (TPR) repeat protein